MTTKEFLDHAKKQMEAEIKDSIIKFHKETGFQVEKIELTTMENSGCSTKSLTNVDVTLDLN